jgi:glycosyltransferase involved in cell wall biosynthesis
MTPTISILIPTLPVRGTMFKKMVKKIHEQASRINAADEIEILFDARGPETPTGTKRNYLLQEATGIYVTGVDDDDQIPDYYIEELLKAAESNADCFAINGVMTTNDTNQIQWFIAKDNPYVAEIRNGKTVYLRHPNHITPIRATIAKQFAFPDIWHGEDYAWCSALKASGLIKTEYIIERPMYWYKFISVK